MITGSPIELVNIRAGRAKPGLMRQHLVCIQASQRISNATVEGAELNSTWIRFEPQHIQSGQYHFDIGSAGSTTLVLQTLLPVLLLQDQPSELTIIGGTHNPLAPTAEFIERCFLSSLRRLGIFVDFTLEEAGFYPIGRGKIHVRIHPWQDRSRLCLIDRGELQSIRASAACLNLPTEAQIADCELKTLSQLLDISSTETLEFCGASKGNTVFVEVVHQNCTQLFTALGEKGQAPEKTAHLLAEQVQLYLESDASVDEYLTDQLLLPLALGQGGEFTTQYISDHTRTQAFMIEKFTTSRIEFTRLNVGDQHQLHVRVTTA